MMRLPANALLIRTAVTLTVIGLVLLVPIVLEITAWGVGLYMLGSLLIAVGLALYVTAVVRELRREGLL